MVQRVAVAGSLLAIAVAIVGFGILASLVHRNDLEPLAAGLLVTMTSLSLSIAISGFLYGRKQRFTTFLVLASATILLMPLVLATAVGAGMLFAPAVMAGLFTLVATGRPRHRG